MHMPVTEEDNHNQKKNSEAKKQSTLPRGRPRPLGSALSPPAPPARRKQLIKTGGPATESVPGSGGRASGPVNRTT